MDKELIPNNEEPINISKGYLTLPIDKEQFSEFIIGLLGNPQEIQNRIDGDFAIGLPELVNIYDLIDQRIIRQNGGKLIQFFVDIYYSDQSSIKLGTIGELKTYNELKSVVPKTVHMTWTYLIHFLDKPAPEKQEIYLKINTEKITQILRFLDTSSSFILTIRHTERTWGIDLESLISNHLKSLISKKGRIVKFFSRNFLAIGVISFLSFLIIGLTGLYFSASKYLNLELEKANKFIHNNQNNIDEKINYLIEKVINNSYDTISAKSTIFFFVLILFSIIFGVTTTNLAYNDSKSFILLTRESYKEKEEFEKQYHRQWMYFIFSLIVGLGINILSSYIFEFILKK